MLFKKAIALLIIGIFVLVSTGTVFALGPSSPCRLNNDLCDRDQGLFCLPDKRNPSDPDQAYCQHDPFKGVFGKVEVPDALKGFISQDPTGTGGLSRFFSNLVALFYSIAGIVLIFMIVWGAFDWLTSEGDKEKVQSAQKKIINAIIGIILFAIAFAVIQVLGHFTGFTFFVGQKP